MQLFIYLPRPRHSSSQWCGTIFRFHVGCRCCSTQPGHSKQKSVFTAAFWFSVRLSHQYLACLTFSSFKKKAQTPSPENTYLNVVASQIKVQNLSSLFSAFFTASSRLACRLLAAVFSPSSVLAWIKSMLGFLGQRRAFIIDYDKSGSVAVPTADNSQSVILEACIQIFTSLQNSSHWSELYNTPWWRLELSCCHGILEDYSCFQSGGVPLVFGVRGWRVIIWENKSWRAENTAVFTSLCFLLSFPSSAPIISPSPPSSPHITTNACHLTPL